MDNQDILNLAKTYSKQGTIMIDLKNSFFSNQDFERLGEICKAVDYETVTIGDAGEQNFVKVGRFMTDEKEPKLVDNKFSKEVREIYYDKKKKKNIYGTATLQERLELEEEGIKLTNIPWVNNKKN